MDYKIKNTKGIKFIGSKTEKNLMDALCGESVARNKYTYYASRAKKDGFEEISRIFIQTADNEKEHAKIWFKLLHDGKIKDTKENLKDAIASEHFENSSMYPSYAKVAKEEGFDDIAKLFELVTTVECYHEKRFQKFFDDLENNKVFEKENEVNWECSNCGYSVKCKKAPKQCPLCKHEQAFFYVENEKY